MQDRPDETGQWGWYYRKALGTVIQACGRVVRAPEDHGATYLADASLLDLFERARTDMPDWFRAQVDRMERPSLPAFAPGDALAGLSNGGRGQSRTSGDTGSDAGHPLSDVWD